MKDARGESVALLVALALMVSACDSSGYTPAMSQTDSATRNPESWIGGIVLGTEEDPVRGVQPSPKFASDESIQVRMNVTDAPANTVVKVAWIDPAGSVLREERRATRIGGDRMTFAAPVTLSWLPGEYRIKVWVGGRQVHEESFEVVSDREQV